MSGIFPLTSYFYRWHPAVPWLMFGGIALTIIAAAANASITANGVQVHAVNTIMLAIGIIFVGVPALFAPRAFQNVLQNQHLALVPKLIRKLGIAALIQTMILTTGATLAHGLRTGEYFIGLAWAFTLSSLYFWAITWAIRQKALPFIVMFLVVAFSFAAIALPRIDNLSLINASVLYLALPATTLYWLVYILRLKPEKPIPDHDAAARNWANVVNQRLARFDPEAAILGFPTTWPQRLSIIGTSVVLVPVIMTLLCAIMLNAMAGFNPEFEEKLDVTEMLWLTLILCASVNAMLGSNYAAMVSRARLLWLKGNNRASLWQLLDRTMIGNSIVISLLLLLISIVSYFSYLEAFVFLGAVCTSIWAWSYFSFATRIKRSAFDWFVLASLVIFGVYTFFDGSINLAILYLATTPMLAIYYRLRAKTLMTDLNWQTLRPNNRELDKRSMVSLW